MKIKILAFVVIIVFISLLCVGCAGLDSQGLRTVSGAEVDGAAPSSASGIHLNSSANSMIQVNAQTQKKEVDKTQDGSKVNTKSQTQSLILEKENGGKQTGNTSKKVVPLTTSDIEHKILSWYYLKKGKGKIPGFPPETQTFTSDQKVVWIGTGKKVYLTFDNGGPMGDTQKLLKTLKDNNVKATFFIAGYNLKAHPDYIRQLVADGNLVANHTMSHKDVTQLSDEQVKKEITDFEKLYKEVTGQELPKYFRFPYGLYNRHLLSLVSNMGYTSVFWSTAMQDWVPRKNRANDPYNDIMNNLHNGNIILMHEGSNDDIEALDRIIKAIKQAGYEFDLINKLHPIK